MPAKSEQISKLLELTESGLISKQYFKKLTEMEAATLLDAASVPQKAGFAAPTYTPPQEVNRLNQVRLGMCFKLVYNKGNAGLVMPKQINSFKTEVKNLYEISMAIELEMQQELS